MGSADDRTFNGEEGIAKLKERLKLVNIEDIVRKAMMHAAEAYSHAKEAYILRDEFFKLIEQHAGADLDSGRLPLAAASLNAALGVADAAVATANIAARAADSALGKPILDHNLLASSQAIPRAYEFIVVKDEKATNLVSDERDDGRDLISEDVALEAVADDAPNIASNDADSDKGNPALLAAKTASTDLDSGERSMQTEAVREATTDLINEDVALEAVANDAPNIASNDADSDKGNPALLAAKTASTNLDFGERSMQTEAVREVMARAREDAAFFMALEAVADANVASGDADSDKDNPALIAASTKLDYGERKAHRKAVRDALALGKIDFLREEESRRLEEERCEKKTNLELERMARLEAVREAMARARVDAALEAVADANVAASDADSDQDNPALLAAKTASTDLDSGERSMQTEAVREVMARARLDAAFFMDLEAVADANVASSDADSDKDNPALIAASTKLDYDEKKAHREALARGKIDFLREEESRRLEEERCEKKKILELELARLEAVREAMARARVDAAMARARLDAALEAVADDNVAASDADSDKGNPALRPEFTKLDYGEGETDREAVREALAQAKTDLLREEERRRLEEEGKAEKERKKKKREEEIKMRDDKRKQKMDKNTKPKDKGKGKGKK